ncbi:uncharacterized protein LOC125368666 isoform X4 [Ricinus communis]|uniref:uncharacterized protein LOC125368666 isoform X4 n=1 Tax=Ricinus communis TaxID=3988 RepID=UPI00201A8624|nr:uncharacterized protein LOC125368666 isoform X4 [Ricinus communis]
MKRRMVLGKLTRCSGVCSFGRIKEYSQVSNGKRLMERELREASEMVGEEHCCISGRGGSGVSVGYESSLYSRRYLCFCTELEQYLLSGRWQEEEEVAAAAVVHF